MSILVVAEFNEQQISLSTRQTLGAAQQLGSEIHLILMGSSGKVAAQNALSVMGLHTVIWVPGDFESPNQWVDFLVPMAPNYSHILMNAGPNGKEGIPRLAARLGVAAFSEVLRIDSPNRFIRPIYAGNLWIEVDAFDDIKLLTIRSTAFEPVSDTGGAATWQEGVGELDSPQSAVVARDIHHSERPPLDSAKVVVSGGRGLGSAEHFEALINPLAEVLNAAIGASRAAVDSGYVPNDYQVGQTGRVVAPELYIAVGISGAIQHVAGMKDSKVIVAINQDPEAPIFAVADYGLVGDLNVFVPQITAALQSLKT